MSYTCGRLGRMAEIEPIRIHDLRPSRHEVADELVLIVVLGVDFGIGAQD